jgi:tRNA(Ile)-lysidine synthase TilS/MesJ
MTRPTWAAARCGNIPWIRRCALCNLPEIHETIAFDERGVCNVCRQHDMKREVVDWAAAKRELDALVAAHRGKADYDCIVPFSGGKDST